MFCNLLFVEMQVGGKPSMPSPIKKGLRHVAEAGNLFDRKIAVIQQSIQKPSAIWRRDV